MKYYFVFIAFVLSITFSFAQKEIEIFKKKSPDYPQFIYDRIEYDSIMFWNKQMTIEAMNGYYSAKAKVSFTVDSIGSIKDLQISDFEMEKIPGYFTPAESKEQTVKISKDLQS